jgi:hypothetical protein
VPRGEGSGRADPFRVSSTGVSSFSDAFVARPAANRNDTVSKSSSLSNSSAILEIQAAGGKVHRRIRSEQCYVLFGKKQ